MLGRARRGARPMLLLLLCWCSSFFSSDMMMNVCRYCLWCDLDAVISLSALSCRRTSTWKFILQLLSREIYIFQNPIHLSHGK